MNASACQPDELAQLLSTLSDGEMTQAQYQRLTEIVTENAEARAYYMRWIFLEARLQRQYGVEPAALSRPQDSTTILLEVLDQEKRLAAQRLQEQTHDRTQSEAEQCERRDNWLRLVGGGEQLTPVRHIVIPRLLVYGAVAALLALAVMFAWPDRVPPRLQPAPQTVRHYQQVATLVEQVDAKWEDASRGYEIDAPIYNVSHRLLEGYAKLRFDNGAEVIVEAPASFEPVAADELKLLAGRLVATCSTEQSHGFTIRTRTSRVVDFGTEFGVVLTDAGDTETHVFDGEVRVSSIDAKGVQPMRLFGGEAALLRPGDRTASKRQANHLAFVREQEFEARSKAEHSIHHRWIAYRYQLQRDPALLAYYDMTRDADGRLIDLGPAAHHGMVLNAIPRDGRFPHTPALMFTEATHGVDIDVPDELRQATFIAWVRLNPPSNERGNDQRAVLLPIEAYQPRYVHWQLEPDGEPRFGWFVQPRKRGITATSPQALAPERWQCMAIVVNCDEQRYRIYIDGQRMLERDMPPDSIAVSAARIGNWTYQDRPLNGAIDELMILRRELDETELRFVASLRPAEQE